MEHGLDNLKTSATNDGRAPQHAIAFRGVPWLWRDLLVGLTPLIALRVVGMWLEGAELPALVRWLLLGLTLLSMAWMLGYPLLIAYQRRARLRLPSVRCVAIEAALAVPAFLLIAGALVAALAAWIFVAGGPPPRNPLEQTTRSGNWVFAAVITLLSATMAPLTEEVFFRGMLYNGLRQRFHPLFAAILQAVVFGLLHAYGFVYAAAAIFMGLALALLYEWRRTILTPIFVHALYNLAAGLIAVVAAIGSANAPTLGVLGEPVVSGCQITKVVAGSGADDAGLRPGDVITAVDGVPVANIKQVAAVVRRKRVNDRVTVEYVRDGAAQRVQAVLKPRPE